MMELPSWMLPFAVGAILGALIGIAATVFWIIDRELK
jgi:hypothetical protein